MKKTVIAILRICALAVLAALSIAPAAAQVPEIRLARQFSMGYLQFNVMEHQQLIEKHARAWAAAGQGVVADVQRASRRQRRAALRLG